MPAIVTAIAVTGGAIAYRLQKNADEKSDLISKRREIYKGLLNHFHDWISLSENPVKESERIAKHQALNSKTISALLLASDEVAIEVGQFRRMLANAIPATGDEKVEKFSKMLLTMRKDCFQESKLTEKEMSSLLPLQGNTERELRKTKK